MKKATKLSVVMLLILCLCSGCSSGKKESTAVSGDAYKASDYVTLGKYKGLESYSVEYTPTEDEVNEYLNSLAEENATFKDIKGRASDAKDYVTIDYSAQDESGKDIDSCKGKELQVCLGDNEVSEDIECALMSRKSGDVVTVTTEIPEALDSEHVGEKATFKIKITTLQEKVVPEITDEFIVDKTEYNTVEDYKEYARRTIKAGYESDYYNQEASRLLNVIVADSKFTEEYPEDLYKECKEDFEDSIEYYASMLGISTDEYLKDYEGLSDTDIDNEVKEGVHQKLVVKALANKLKINPSDEEYESYITQMAASYGYSDVDSFKEVYSEEALKFSRIYNDVITLIMEKADVTVVSPTEYDEKFNTHDTSSTDSHNHSQEDAGDKAE